MKKAYVAGQWVETGTQLKVYNPYNDQLVDTVAQCGPHEIDRALDGAVDALEQTSRMQPYERAACLAKIRDGIAARGAEFARVLSLENGKTLAESTLEVARAVATFDIAVGEATRIYGEAYDLGINPMGSGRRALVRKYPIGVVSAIAPFNFPINLAVHKIAPALAVGCPVVLKPASLTPLTALMMAEVVEASGWPKQAFSVVPCNRSAGQMLVEDERIKLLSFTGSPEVGWKMKSEAGKKKVVLELGGNAGLIIDHNVKDWDHLIQRAILGAFYQCGQVCISVQRIFVHQDVMGEFRARFAKAAQALVIGDPLDAKTTLGPVIDRANVERLQGWIQEALDQGAALVTGNTIADVGAGNSMTATILEEVDAGCRINADEAFGPVVTLTPVQSMDEAFHLVNNSRFGLQCGLFTQDFATVMRALDQLEVGGVIHNDVPSFRVDSMPYGGVKDSGLGREGVKYAMEDMLEPRVLVY
ncbi:aldehyde dehydrogenase [Magnetococcus marinus MC-1]|uniref:Aldehyde dehydrogenase n=1 Tax=Magnetococcus marinus (strain ATCC BAA-1437 / JCM 17883 / MC-1) TaxID=156889 RepID=A0L5V5_MAGMM|nr:aldehyde dehydrogenase family protein [Magnetococcus marinus]ABK43348.1 aldehyde dehydrogenase [Magnetococcus marinus MC-1]